MKISLLSIGGLGIEVKQISSSNIIKEICTIGGSSWHMALAGKALGCKSTIMASIGNDSWGQYLRSILNKHDITFIGIITNKTQEYSSVIKDGIPLSFTATLENITTYQVINCFDKGKPKYDILLVGYMNYDVLPYVLQQRQDNKNILLVLNMSDAILSIPNDKIVEYLSGFDIITMNKHEAETLANKLNITFETLLKTVNSKRNMIFITSISSVTYVMNRYIYTHHFTPLNYVEDSTGAGDAFAVSIAVATYKGMPLDRILQQAIHSAHSMCGIVKKENVKDLAWLI